MTQAGPAKRKKKRARRWLYLECKRLIDPDTGELVGAFRPLTQWDQRAMRERKYSVGTKLRASLEKPRNYKFHKLAHAMAAMVIESIDEFHGKAIHDVLKRLQADAGAACDVAEYSLPDGMKFTRSEPRSLAFDEMDEGEFQEVMRTIYRHISQRYWPDMDEIAIEGMVEMYEKNHSGGIA